MTSAPSDASFTACARPWPRAAPVTKATRPLSDPMSAAELTLGGIACDDGLEHLDGGRTVEVVADGTEQRADRGGGAVGLECVLVGPLLDEDERAVGLVQ